MNRCSRTRFAASPPTPNTSGSLLRTIDGPIVLVGHSYGGAVITNAAVGVPNVKALVYIAGFARDKGELLIQLVTKNPWRIVRTPRSRTSRRHTCR